MALRVFHVSIEKVSSNAKIVLLGLFVLVGVIVGVFGYVTMQSQNIPEGVAGIFSTAVTGAFTMGGVLVTNLWGK